MIKVFFDSSVLFSAISSDKGAAYRLAYLTKMRKIMGIATLNVFLEVERNKQKLRESVNIQEFFEESLIIIREKITEAEIKEFERFIEEKDAHVLAGAILSGCDYLVTLDKKHINNSRVKKKNKRVKIISPGDLVKLIASDEERGIIE